MLTSNALKRAVEASAGPLGLSEIGGKPETVTEKKIKEPGTKPSRASGPLQSPQHMKKTQL